MQSLEYVCEEYGGRVEIAKAYYDGLSNSIFKNFNGSGIIASMQQCNDFFFLGTKQVPLGRVGKHYYSITFDEFYCSIHKICKENEINQVLKYRG